MQTTRKNWQITLLALCAAMSACKEQESFDSAIAKHRKTFVDQVNKPAQGPSYYTIQTLNPTWDVSKPAELVTVPAFSLTDQNGKAQTEKLFDDKITIVGFMFASCQGFCPFVVENMKSIERSFKEKSKGNIQFVAITVDPENDTPAQLKSYAKRKGLTSSDWHLLTGKQETIFSLAKKTFASQAFKKPSKDPNFIHSEHLYVIGPDRRLRGILNGTRVDSSKEAKVVIDPLLPLRVAVAK